MFITMKALKNKFYYPLLATLGNIALVVFAYFVCRLVFVLLNGELLTKVTLQRFFALEFHSLRFDLCGIVYSNLPYILLALVPFGFRAGQSYQKVLKWLFITVNSIWIVVNFADSVFFQYTEKRTTISFFTEFQAESNLFKIFVIELVSHWYLVILAALLTFGLVKLYMEPNPPLTRRNYGLTDYLLHTLTLIAGCVLALGGIRGSYNYEERPLMLMNATEYVEEPSECGIILNTTFCMFRTVGNDDFEVPDYFSTAEQRSTMTEMFNPVHFNPKASFRQKNVVVFILESFGSCYSGYVSSLLGAPHQGYMPYLDSLMQESLRFRYSFANGNISIDAIPSTMCGLIPMIESISSTEYVSNNIPSLATYLGKKGYHTAFFHGAPAGSMGLTSFAKTVGFDYRYALENYPDQNDFDGTWSIWDGKFIDYMGEEISRWDKPFLATIFTATSHHPFRVPDELADNYPDGEFPISKCVRYVDDSIRQFMEKYSDREWFKNTLFVFTADHSGPFSHKEYTSITGSYAIPVFFYSPAGDLNHLDEGLAQQTDITPTVLGYLGYDEPFLAFGNNLLETGLEDRFALNYTSGIYNFIKGEWSLLYNGDKVIGLYDFKNDFMQENDLAAEHPEVIEGMLPQLKSIIQQYLERITENTFDQY